MARLSRDPRDRDTGAVGLGGVSGAERVAGDPLQVVVGQPPTPLEWRSGQPWDHRSEVGCVFLDVSGGFGRCRG